MLADTEFIPKVGREAGARPRSPLRGGKNAEDPGPRGSRAEERGGRRSSASSLGPAVCRSGVRRKRQLTCGARLIMWGPLPRQVKPQWKPTRDPKPTSLETEGCYITGFADERQNSYYGDSRGMLKALFHKGIIFSFSNITVHFPWLIAFQNKKNCTFHLKYYKSMAFIHYILFGTF